MATISNPANDRRSLTHTGMEVGDDNVELVQNQVDNNSPILKWSCPRKYDQIRYAGGSHKTKFQPRTKQVETIADADGSGTLEEGERTVALDNIIQAVHGEEVLDDQQYPVVVVGNVTQGGEVEVVDVNYANNEVTVAEADVADGDDVALFPILAEGTAQYRGLDQFDHEIGPLDEWSVPLHVFHDFDQDKNETEIHLIGAAQWSESETLGLFIDAPHQVVWEDADYPHGNYVSTIEQRVDVTV